MKLFRRTLTALLALCMVFSLFSADAFSAGTEATGTFTAVSMNVDGLPQKIAFVSINSDGPGSAGTKKISNKIAEYDWDIIGVSEDFNFNTELMSGLPNYSSGTHRGGISGFHNNTDGLNLIWKDSIAVSGEKWTSWNTHYSSGIMGTGNGADGMIDKGYRYYEATIAEGVTVDVYILHMDADSDPEDISARESQLTQLANAIKASNNGNPIIVMGDTNCRYTRENLKKLFIDAINADSRFTIQDAWIEKVRNGSYPAYGADALVAKDKGGTYDYPDAEIVDKVFYINNTDSDVTLSANSYTIATDFTDSNGKALADHWPVVVEFTYTVAGAHSHSYTSTVTKKPTCTEKGVTTYSCSCSDSYTEEIAALGHNYVAAKSDASCTEEAVTTYTCSRCGDSYTEKSPCLGHDYHSAVTKEPTCAEKGVRTYTCSGCGDSYTEEIAALGHNYVATETKGSCTEAGVITYTCTRCGDTYTENSAALGHDYHSSVTKEPTCTEKGVRTYTCSRCGDSYTEEIDATGHHYVNGTCTGCGEADPDAPVVTKPTVGNATTNIESGKKYALVFYSTSGNYALTHDTSGKLTSVLFKKAVGDTIDDSMVWIITKVDGGYTIAAEIDGQIMYLGRTKSFVGYGYKIGLQSSPFVWSLKVDTASYKVFFYTRIVSSNYYLRYYNARLGWIVTRQAVGFTLHEIKE